MLCKGSRAYNSQDVPHHMSPSYQIQALHAGLETERARLNEGRARVSFTRRTTSTALQLAVDHAFTGSYARRFRPADPPETHLCVCGPVLRDPAHLLTRCPLFHQQRVDAIIITDHRTLSLRQLFQTHPERLLAFLQAPGIARPPPNTSQREWVEEEADTGIG